MRFNYSIILYKLLVEKNNLTFNLIKLFKFYLEIYFKKHLKYQYLIL
jgi:hypothetical protein